MARGATERGTVARGARQPSIEGELSKPKPTARGYFQARYAGRKLKDYTLPAKGSDEKGTKAVLEAALEAVRNLGAAKALDLITSKTRGDHGTHKGSSRSSAATPQAEITSIGDYREHEARRWKEIRDGFLEEHKSVTAPELAKLTGSKAGNPSSRAYTWAKKGLIFSVNDGSADRYPLFQLRPDDGKPRPEIKAILEVLKSKLSNWQVAIWFTAPNAWTGDWRRPVDLLDKDPAAVLVAARQEVAEQVL